MQGEEVYQQYKNITYFNDRARSMLSFLQQEADESTTRKKYLTGKQLADAFSKHARENSAAFAIFLHNHVAGKTGLQQRFALQDVQFYKQLYAENFAAVDWLVLQDFSSLTEKEQRAWQAYADTFSEKKSPDEAYAHYVKIRKLSGRSLPETPSLAFARLGQSLLVLEEQNGDFSEGRTVIKPKANRGLANK